MVWQGLLAKRAWLTGCSRTWQAQRLEGCLTLASCDCICFTSLSADTDAKWPPWIPGKGNHGTLTQPPQVGSGNTLQSYKSALAPRGTAKEGEVEEIHSNTHSLIYHKTQQHHTTTGKIAAKHKTSNHSNTAFPSTLSSKLGLWYSSS